MVRRLLALAPVVFTGISVLTSPAAHAEDVKLPPTMTFTAYDTGTAGFNIAVAVGKMMKDKYGTDVRVLPAGNDVARLAPLRAGRGIPVDVVACNHCFGDGVDLLRGLGPISHKDRVRIVAEFDWLFLGDAGAAGRDMPKEE